MKLPRRKFLHLAAGAGALPAASLRRGQYASSFHFRLEAGMTTPRAWLQATCHA